MKHGIEKNKEANLAQIQIPGTTCGELMVVLSQIENAEMVDAMIASAKEKWVLSKHNREIYSVSSGKKVGKYRTYIGSPRKAMLASG